MAVYRSDQAQLTFGPEAAPGGYPELASTPNGSAAGTALIDMAAGLPAGSTKITVSALSGITAGEDVQIGPGVNGTGTLAESEFRRVEYVEGATTLFLDAPTAFFHPNDTNLIAYAAVDTVAADIYMNQIPGVYDTVDVPDPEFTIEPRYFLGTASKRNFFAAYKGQQAFTGSVQALFY